MQQSSISVFVPDLLRLAEEPRLISQLDSSETVAGSCEIQQFNHDNKCSQKLMLITNLGLYNIIRCNNIIKSMISKLVAYHPKFIVKKKVEYEQIEAITLSNSQSNLQFIVHLYSQEDLHYKTLDYKQKVSVLKRICFEYQEKTNKKLAFYFTNQINLKNKRRIKGKAKGVCTAILQGLPVYLNVQDLIEYELPGINFEQKYSWNDEVIEITRFKSLGSIEFHDNCRYFTIIKKQIGFQQILPFFGNQHQFISLPDYVYQTSSILYLLRPLYFGGRMDKLLNKVGVIQKQPLAFYVAQMILVLEYLHQKGWIYTSLTLQNIYIDELGYIKVEGIHKYMRKKKPLGQKCFSFMGQEDNIPPQVIFCQGYNESIDIWQLGICAYQMLRNVHPFRTANKRESIKNIIEKELDKQKEQVPFFIRKMLQKNPQERITVEELKKDKFFSEIDWEKLIARKIQPLYKPQKMEVKQWQGDLPAIVFLSNK